MLYEQVEIKAVETNIQIMLLINLFKILNI